MVMKEGEVVGEVINDPSLTQENLMSMAIGESVHKN